MGMEATKYPSSNYSPLPGGTRQGGSTAQTAAGDWVLKAGVLVPQPGQHSTPADLGLWARPVISA